MSTTNMSGEATVTVANMRKRSRDADADDDSDNDIATDIGVPPKKRQCRPHSDITRDDMGEVTYAPGPFRGGSRAWHVLQTFMKEPVFEYSTNAVFDAVDLGVIGQPIIRYSAESKEPMCKLSSEYSASICIDWSATDLDQPSSTVGGALRLFAPQAVPWLKENRRTRFPSVLHAWQALRMATRADFDAFCEHGRFATLPARRGAFESAGMPHPFATSTSAKDRTDKFGRAYRGKKLVLVGIVAAKAAELPRSARLGLSRYPPPPEQTENPHEARKAHFIIWCYLLGLKFTQHSELYELLRGTGQSYLLSYTKPAAAANTKTPVSFWHGCIQLQPGQTPYAPATPVLQGANTLGRYLMFVRRKLTSG